MGSAGASRRRTAIRREVVRCGAGSEAIEQLQAGRKSASVARHSGPTVARHQGDPPVHGTRKAHPKRTMDGPLEMVEVTGFEPAASWSRTTVLGRANAENGGSPCVGIVGGGVRF